MKALVIALTTISITTIATAQTQTQSQNNENISGGYESFSEWYQNDFKTGSSFTPSDARFLSNHYFKADYTLGRFAAGAQYEAYLPAPLLGYFPGLKGNALATYYGSFKVDQLEATAGYFYDQFGSGLVFRSWEDRQLGTNNAIKGVRVKLQPTSFLAVTALSGYQRVGFETSKGQINGLNSELDLGNLFDFADLGIRFGGSYVGRYIPPSGSEPSTVNAYSGRFNLDYGGLSLGAEYVAKGKDLRPDFSGSGINYYDPGSALLGTIGYAKQGFGLTAQYRRLENMGFYSDTDPNIVNNPFNSQVINYLPALTKQHDYNVTNLYRYSSHGNMVFNQGVFGENGGQVDVFFNLPKGSSLGGRFGTKVALNYAVWYGLGAKIDTANNKYTINKEFGTKYFQDANIEIKKKWSQNWSSIFSYINIFYNATVPGLSAAQQGATGLINANIFAVESTHRWNTRASTRLLLEHLSTADDLKSWASATLEQGFSSHYSMYVTDLYNYGNPDPTQRIHYYTIGASYMQGPTRIALTYGRQRGGLICSGGVCRYVPPNTGLNITISTTF
ncbi:MAG: DUF6029 family protein [Sphingobacteriaceae bacterium]